MSEQFEKSPWFPDMRALLFLKRLTVPDVMRLVPLDEIVIDVNNNVRNQVLDQERVHTYARKQLEGIAFPAVVLRYHEERKAKKYEILGGTHRIVASVESGTDPVLAHIVVTDDEELVDRIKLLLNNMEGVTSSNAERIARAVQRVLEYKWSVKRAALEFDISEGVLEREIKTRRVTERLADCGIRGSKLISATALADLDTLENNKVLSAVFSVAANANLTVEATREIIKKVKKKRDQDAQLEAVTNEARIYNVSTELQPTNGHVEPHPPKTQKTIVLASAVTRLSNFLDANSTLARVGVTKKTEIEFHTIKIRSLIKKLRHLLEGH